MRAFLFCLNSEGHYLSTGASTPEVAGSNLESLVMW